MSFGNGTATTDVTPKESPQDPSVAISIKMVRLTNYHRSKRCVAVTPGVEARNSIAIGATRKHVVFLRVIAWFHLKKSNTQTLGNRLATPADHFVTRERGDHLAQRPLRNFSGKSAISTVLRQTPRQLH
jgi:hypothetical protein